MKKIGFTKRSLLKRTFPEFQEWATENEVIERDLMKYASGLKDLLKIAVRDEVDRKKFGTALLETTGQMANINFDLEYVGLAYAARFFLDRYVRLRHILPKLWEYGVLPVGTNELKILDLGTGPGNALFALHDLYQDINAFAKVNEPRLETQVEALRYVEQSHEMRGFLTRFSESFIRTEVWGIEEDLKNLDLIQDRGGMRRRLIGDWAQADEETSYEGIVHYVDHVDTGWKNKFRHNIVICMYMFTTEERMQEHEYNFGTALRMLNNGGIGMLVGYPVKGHDVIFETADQLAQSAGCKIMKFEQLEYFKHKLSDRERKIIKGVLNELRELVKGHKVSEYKIFKVDKKGDFRVRIYRKGRWINSEKT